MKKIILLYMLLFGIVACNNFDEYVVEENGELITIVDSNYLIKKAKEQNKEFVQLKKHYRKDIYFTMSNYVGDTVITSKNYSKTEGKLVVRSATYKTVKLNNIYKKR
jgi:hypothetical protein